MEDARVRLTQITHDLAIGGLQRVVSNICRTIDRDRFDVRVLCLRALGPFAADIERLGIPVSLLPQTGRTDYFSFLKVARILRAERIEVIHTHNTQPFVDGTIGALMSGVRTIVHTDHARQFPDKRRYMLAERVMSAFAYRVVAVSNDTAANLTKYEKIPRSRIEVIPNGIDGSVFDDPVGREAKRRELGVAADAPLLGIAARLSPPKGVIHAIRAMPGVLAREPRATLVVAGEGPLEPELKAEAVRLGVSNEVKFIGPRADVPELLETFDLYLLPSVSEGLPMVVLEAMAAGCPIVATAVGGVPSAIEHEVNGLLVAPQDPGALTGAILRALGDDVLRRRLAAEGKRVFASRYSAEAMTRRYERLYLRQGS